MNSIPEQPVRSQYRITFSAGALLITLSLFLLSSASFLTYYFMDNPSVWVRSTSLFFFIVSYFYSLLLYHVLFNSKENKRKPAMTGIIFASFSLLYLLPGIIAPPLINHIVKGGMLFSDRFFSVFEAGFKINEMNRSMMIFLCIGFVLSSFLCYWKKAPALVLQANKALSLLSFSLFFTYIHMNFYNLFILLVYSWL